MKNFNFYSLPDFKEDFSFFRPILLKVFFRVNANLEMHLLALKKFICKGALAQRDIGRSAKCRSHAARHSTPEVQSSHAYVDPVSHAKLYILTA